MTKTTDYLLAIPEEEKLLTDSSGLNVTKSFDNLDKVSSTSSDQYPKITFGTTDDLDKKVVKANRMKSKMIYLKDTVKNQSKRRKQRLDALPDTVSTMRQKLVRKNKKDSAKLQDLIADLQTENELLRKMLRTQTPRSDEFRLDGGKFSLSSPSHNKELTKWSLDIPKHGLSEAQLSNAQRRRNTTFLEFPLSQGLSK